jgi:hypothetical protein
MSKLFGSKSNDASDQQGKLPLLSDLQPEIEAEADRLEALPLPQLAAEVLTTAFAADYKPDGGMLEMEEIVDAFVPPHGEWTSSWKERPAPPEALDRLRDLIREGVQRLEHTGLLMPTGYTATWYHVGYVTTRRGRAALADGSVERVLSTAATSA